MARQTHCLAPILVQSNSNVQNSPMDMLSNQLKRKITALFFLYRWPENFFCILVDIHTLTHSHTHTLTGMLSYLNGAVCEAPSSSSGCEGLP